MRSPIWIVLWLASALASGCAGRDPEPLPVTDGGGPTADAGPPAPALSILAIDPDLGPLEGGTPVVITGTGFHVDLAAALGNRALEDLYVVDEHTIEARTPPALEPGLANLVIRNPDGQSAQLVDAFLYEPPPPVPVGWCNFVAPARAVVGVSERLEVRARVFSPGHTPGAGRAAGLLVQIVYGFPDADVSSWTPLPAAYAGDVDGLAQGDLANDEYVGSVASPLPATYRVAARVSGDLGQTWSYCDRDGLENGFSQDQTLELVVRQRVIDYCRVLGPVAATAPPGASSPPFTAELFVAGVTDAAGRGANIRAELGFGPPGETPIALSWLWTSASYAGDATGLDPNVLANDRYEAALVVPSLGTYDVAFRFSADDGGTWTYCDLDGSDNGYSSAQAASLRAEPTALRIDYCRLLGPASTTVLPGQASEPLRAEVYELGVTEGVGRGDGVRVQVGYGPTTAAPGGPTWSFVDAAYDGDVNGLGVLDNDLYVASLSASIPGDYATAARASVDDGATWTYCDLDGTDNGFDLAAQSARLVVRPVEIGFCSVNGASPSAFVAGQRVDVQGRVFVFGRTPGAGAGSGIRGQAGFGALAASPSTWSWTDASYTRDVDGLSSGDQSNDEYAASFVVAAAGAHRVAFRFSVDGGVSWTYCDRGGSHDGFDAADTIEVTAAPLSVGYCEYTSPASMNAVLGTPSPQAVGRVFVDGRTQGAGAGANLRMQVGYGPAADAPTASSWRFTEAAYARDVDGLSPGDSSNDEYVASFTPAALGAFALVYRASVDGGATWTLCDRDGSSNGFDVSQAGSLVVVAPGPPIEACSLSGPLSVVALEGAMSPPIEASLRVNGVTDGAGAGMGVAGQLGYGPVGAAPSDAGFVWTNASYARDALGLAEDVYEARFTIPTPGLYDVAYRFTTNGGITFTHCDSDGSQNGYDSDLAGALDARKPITWCNLQFPATTSSVSGAATEEIFGRVFVPGVTEGAGQGALVRAELGFGAVGVDPSDASWSWSPAAYNASAAVAEHDEYVGRITATAPAGGAFDYTLRFSTDDGQSWCYGRTAAGSALGRLTVSPVAIADARVQAPATIYAVAGLPPEPIFVQVSVPGYSPGSGAASGAGLVNAEVLVGPAGALPPTGFTAAAAAYFVFGPSDAYDEHSASLGALAAGDYDLAARFALAAGGAPVLGDLDGSASGGYQTAQAKRLVVRAPAGGGIDYCATQFPTSVVVTMGADGGVSGVIYGRVFKASVTSGAGWGAGVAGQLGWGDASAAPSTWSTWANAGYRRDVDGLVSGGLANDEYEGIVQLPPATSGTLGYAFRFSADGGASWTYCGLAPDGSGGAFVPGTIQLQ